MTKAAQLHKSRVAELGCILCLRLGIYDTPACLHHIREGQGMSQRASDWEVIPLCREHHQGDTGIHGLGRRAFVKRYGVTERELLDHVLASLGETP